MSHPVDEHVGARLRELRKAAGLSQSTLGERLGITFQQIQKYERGTNRISASKLHEAAQVLGVTIADFFAGLPGASNTLPVPGDLAADKDVRRLAHAFEGVPTGVRRQLLDLAEALGRDGHS